MARTATTMGGANSGLKVAAMTRTTDDGSSAFLYFNVRSESGVDVDSAPSPFGSGIRPSGRSFSSTMKRTFSSETFRLIASPTRCAIAG